MPHVSDSAHILQRDYRSWGKDADHETGGPPDALGEEATTSVVRATHFSPRHALFLALIAVPNPLFWIPLKSLLSSSVSGNSLYDTSSYTLLIPFLSAFLLYRKRDQIFANVKCGFRVGLPLLLVGLSWGVIGRFAWDQNSEFRALCISIAGLVLCWLGGFVLFYGTRAFRKAMFPLLLLLLAVPVPDWWLDKPIAAVRFGSTEVCSMALSLTGIPFVRSGYEFFLNHVSIVVAPECSGIHSTLAILLISLVAGHLYLSSAVRKAVLVLCALPIVCVTNGLRITTLTLLAEYVDPNILQSRLHYQGGMVFFALALVLLIATLHLLREGRQASSTLPDLDSHASPRPLGEMADRRGTFANRTATGEGGEVDQFPSATSYP